MIDQAFGQLAALAIGDYPARDEAAEDIHDDVQVIVGPLGRAAQFGDVSLHNWLPRGSAAVNRLEGSAHAIFTTRTPWSAHSLRGGSACKDGLILARIQVSPLPEST